ncbi:hotdog fold thioesterase [Kangiella sediminilitoris]|uniref:Putative thioesterase n=1 Tax=Kangiella sediminilitoris TaxID=1144748 RepID=A0A1B3B7Y4_9GAMM|nr:hotdog fold thioesterase [Kangiella sediminilitoris]AOE48902.1 Putative thioesterase [Kangiella sediminilitoris]
MSIWFEQPNLDEVNSWSKGTMLEHIGIEITDIGDDYLEGTMPADQRTFQPYGLVHGGANIVLAETLGSIGGMLTIDPDKYICVGQEVNGNHLRGVRSGVVRGRAQRIHGGSTSQVWEIKLYDDKNKLSCISRLTLAVVKKR